MRGERTLVVVCLVLAAGLCAGGTEAQDRSDGTKNLLYYPEETKRSELIPDMRRFSFALGVACTYCHGTEEQTGFDLQGVDFSLDAKATKSKAREMLRMVDEINAKLLPRVPDRSSLDLKVTCATCHSGLPLPETIEDRVRRALETEGIEAAVADYRSAREHYFGRSAYDFGEQPLAEVASALFQTGSYEASAAISRLNLEFHPESFQSKIRLADAAASLGNLEEARGLYEELLADRPGNEHLLERLEGLNPPDP